MALGTVTNARASGDYHAGSDQWRPLGTTGIFGWAVAIAPTKDNYWSTDKQAGSAYGDYARISEPYNRLQAAVSTLTKGPVAPSDKIGASDTALILKSCAADGKLLQGDKPAMLIDSAHVLLAFSGGGPSHGRSKECRTAHSSKERRRPLFCQPFSTVTEPPPGLLVPLSGILASRRRKPRKNEKKRGKNGRDMA